MQDAREACHELAAGLLLGELVGRVHDAVLEVGVGRAVGGAQRVHSAADGGPARGALEGLGIALGSEGALFRDVCRGRGVVHGHGLVLGEDVARGARGVYGLRARAARPRSEFQHLERQGLRQGTQCAPGLRSGLH